MSLLLLRDYKLQILFKLKTIVFLVILLNLIEGLPIKIRFSNL